MAKSGTNNGEIQSKEGQQEGKANNDASNDDKTSLGGGQRGCDAKAHRTPFPN